MSHLKLQHVYHDSMLHSVEVDGSTVTLEVDLNAHWNKGCAETCHVFLRGVRNIGEVRQTLRMHRRQVVAELDAAILDIVRDDDGSIVAVLARIGALRVDCASIQET